ncbi:CopG family ribbon-helix-helix protein [Jiella sp. M17.18]|uniref:CopG family ribbon-helix-helix protein n=1 Tax=Jiella sp. M17.18 TaxID=3234247 RepID=UPI0034DEE91E
MSVTVELTAELKARVEALAARSRRSVSDVMKDALEGGLSLEWQEHYLDRVEAGIAAAEDGDFAGPEDVERVLAKYRG